MNTSAPVRKPCEGPAPSLSPLKFSHLQRVNTAESAASAPAAAPVGPPKYVPPTLRRAGTDLSAAATPKSISSDQLSSTDLFPALGATPKPATPGTVGSWTQLRSRFNPASPAPTSASSVAPSRQNSFAALDEDAAQSVSGASVSTLNYSAMMKTRIKNEVKEAEMREVPETDDPLKMEEEQLEREGWGLLKIPRDARAYLKEKWAAAATELTAPTSPEDDEYAYFQNGQTWDSLDVVRRAMYEFTTPEALLLSVLGPQKQVVMTPDACSSPQSPRPEFMEPLSTDSYSQPRSVNPHYIAPAPVSVILERKRVSLRRRRGVVAAAAY